MLPCVRVHTCDPRANQMLEKPFMLPCKTSVSAYWSPCMFERGTGPRRGYKFQVHAGNPRIPPPPATPQYPSCPWLPLLPTYQEWHSSGHWQLCDFLERLTSLWICLPGCETATLPKPAVRVSVLCFVPNHLWLTYTWETTNWAPRELKLCAKDSRIQTASCSIFCKCLLDL